MLNKHTFFIFSHNNEVLVKQCLKHTVLEVWLKLSRTLKLPVTRQGASLPTKTQGYPDSTEISLPFPAPHTFLHLSCNFELFFQMLMLIKVGK